MAASEKYEYILYMLDLLKDCCYCFLLSLNEKHLNKPIIYHDFYFLLEKVLEICQVYYTIFFIVLNLFLFVSRFSAFVNYYFFRWLAYKSLSRFSVLINLFCDLTIFFLYPAVSHVFHGPGYFGSKSRVWVQVLEVVQL